MFDIRRYVPETDREGLLRVWSETGWYPKYEKAKLGVMADFAAQTPTWVGCFNGDVEALVVTTDGTVQYDTRRLPFVGIMAVVVGRVTRKMGIGGLLTARAILDAVERGAAVAGLGAFEQGFYDRMGFGTSAYRTRVSFDPAHLITRVKARPPRRVSVDEWEDMHAARCRRRQAHGSLNLDLSFTGRTALVPVADPIILGYDDGPNGGLSHYVVLGNAPNPDLGPYEIWFMVWETDKQFQELIAVLAGQGDQILKMSIIQPPGIQWQDLLTMPIRQFESTRGSRFAGGITALGDRQLRILDLGACVGAVVHDGAPLSFNLALSDPIERYLPDDAPWRGVAGQYVVHLGEASSVVRDTDHALPTLQASIGAFTRMWFGVRPASGLMLTDELDGPPELIAALDKAFSLPEPQFDWVI